MKIIPIVILFISLSLFAMGGNKLGPNGGFIKMPGSYHVELVDKGETYQVFLLDMSMKNATTENSSLNINYSRILNQKINCTPMQNFFSCKKSNSGLRNYTEIAIESVRNKVKGSVTRYKIPLELEK